MEVRAVLNAERASFDPAPPRHVAIIMDGNGRWAKARHLPRAVGHKRGADAVSRTVRACHELGVSCLTLYAFSSENWKRPVDEVSDLMGLLRLYLVRELDDLHRNGVRVRFIGGRERLDGDIVSLIMEAETRTASNAGLLLVIAVNYGGRSEIVAASRQLAAAAAAGRIDPASIDEAAFEACLETTGIPDPDLVIRTSGEKRISNFLLWQAAYAEFVFTDILWPDFGKEHLEDAIAEFRLRERRYGARSGG